MHRRRLLAALPAAFAASAGCLAASSPPPQAHLDELWFVNESDEAVTVDAAVDADGETVYETSLDLGPSVVDPEPPSNRVRDPELDDTGAYVVRATLDGETVAVDTTETVDGDEDCVLAKFVVSRRGSLHARPSTYTDC